MLGKLAGWPKRVSESTVHLHRFNIGPRLTLCFLLIILALLVGNAVSLWQFHLARTQADRLNAVDQELIAVLQAHTSLMSFYERLDVLADSENTAQLVTEVEALRNATLQESRRSRGALSRLQPELQLDPALLPTLLSIQDTLPAELEAITALAKSNEWQAVRLRLANQVRPLESRSSALVQNIDREVGEERAQAVLNIAHAQRRILWILTTTAVLTLLFAAFLGLAITRSVTQPLSRLVEGSKALARGEFQHQVPVTGNDELAHLTQVFNDTATRLQSLYATLQQSEDRLRLVIDTIPAHAWSARPDGAVDFINQRFLEFTGRSMEEMLGWGWGALVHPDDLARYVDEWRSAVAAGQPMESEARVRRMDGDYRWLLIRNVPLRDERGSIVKWYGTAIDIQERRQAEDALRQSEAYLAEAQRLSHTGSWAWNIGTERQFWSVETFQIFGLDPNAATPTRDTFLERVHPDDRASIELVETQLYKGNDAEYNYRVILPDSSIKYITSVAHPIRDHSGHVIEFVGTVMDVTERKRAEEELCEAQANLVRVSRVTTMGELTASLAHEIRQPIAAAVTNARTCLRWLGRDKPDVAEAREAASRIVTDVNRAGDIISSISLLFKKGALQRVLVDVNELIQEMILLLRSEADRYSISFRTELAEGVPKVMADRVQLQQVFMNLMLNGIDAMKARDTRELTIKSEASDGQLLISVSDTGVGLPPAQVDQIFRAFFTTKESGTGMGLAISRSIIESHGGRLWVACNSGCGATFHFTLPVTAAAHA